MEDEVPDRNGVLGKARADLAPVLLDQDRHGHHQGAAGVVEDASGGLDHEGRHGGQCWKLSVAGSPGVMSMSVSPTFSASNTRESGISCCTSALVVVLPAPWVPLSHTIMDLTLASCGPRGQAEMSVCDKSDASPVTTRMLRPIPFASSFDPASDNF